MATWFQATELHVSPPRKQVADTERPAYVFPSPSDITGATAAIEEVTSGDDAAALIQDVAVDLAENTATVVLEGFTRGVDYLLRVTFDLADTTKETWLLTIQCIA